MQVLNGEWECGGDWLQATDEGEVDGDEEVWEEMRLEITPVTPNTGHTYL